MRDLRVGRVEKLRKIIRFLRIRERVRRAQQEEDTAPTPKSNGFWTSVDKLRNRILNCDRPNPAFERLLFDELCGARFAQPARSKGNRMETFRLRRQAGCLRAADADTEIVIAPRAGLGCVR